jgi:hypothetical protein
MKYFFTVLLVFIMGVGIGARFFSEIEVSEDLIEKVARETIKIRDIRQQKEVEAFAAWHHRILISEEEYKELNRKKILSDEIFRSGFEAGQKYCPKCPKHGFLWFGRR